MACPPSGHAMWSSPNSFRATPAAASRSFAIVPWLSPESARSCHSPACRQSAQAAAGAFPHRRACQRQRSTRRWSRLVDMPIFSSSRPQFGWLMYLSSTSMRGGVAFSGRLCLCLCICMCRHMFVCHTSPASACGLWWHREHRARMRSLDDGGGGLRPLQAGASGHSSCAKVRRGLQGWHAVGFPRHVVRYGGPKSSGVRAEVWAASPMEGRPAASLQGSLREASQASSGVESHIARGKPRHLQTQ